MASRRPTDLSQPAAAANDIAGLWMARQMRLQLRITFIIQQLQYPFGERWRLDKDHRGKLRHWRSKRKDKFRRPLDLIRFSHFRLGLELPPP